MKNSGLKYRKVLWERQILLLQLLLRDLFSDDNLWKNSLAKQINACYIFKLILVGVAQLVEHWVVASVVVGSSPITHPINFHNKRGSLTPSFIVLSL